MLNFKIKIKSKFDISNLAKRITRNEANDIGDIRKYGSNHVLNQLR